ncbi:PDZ domain-containing protein [candidate division TA06 bacterium]|uniref:PDZ domain-containing protein n=1 Tax=candidate division TA06 bacterium TaxID=2250710 RepID=A0A523UZ94_UNCT6|nr:MAG: PDZ domain-containing protein [candidate division TA06 bacterium]
MIRFLNRAILYSLVFSMGCSPTALVEKKKSVPSENAGAWLGVAVTPADRKTSKGVTIVKVSAGGPAEKAGLQENDIIIELDGDTVATCRDLHRLIRERKPGEEVVLLVRRNSRQEETRVRLEAQPAPRGSSYEKRFAGSRIIGIEVRESGGKLRNDLVDYVELKENDVYSEKKVEEAKEGLKKKTGCYLVEPSITLYPSGVFVGFTMMETAASLERDLEEPIEVSDEAEKLFSTYDRYNEAWLAHLSSKATDNSATSGTMQAYEREFLDSVQPNVKELVTILKRGSVDQRAKAACLLKWARDKESVIDPLVEAFDDPSHRIHNDAARSLLAISRTGVEEIPIEPVIGLLSHEAWPCQNKAVYLLLSLLDKHQNAEGIARGRFLI